MITIKHGAWEPYAHGATVHGHAAQDERPMEYYVGIDPPFSQCQRYVMLERWIYGCFIVHIHFNMWCN